MTEQLTHFRHAQWIWSGPADGYNDFRQVRHDFTLAAAPPEAELWITADALYQVWLNGRMLGHGPAKSAEGAREAWGVSAKTGEVFWSYPTPMHHSLISSPVATGSRVVLCGGQGAAAFSACLQMYVRDGKVRARQLYRSEKNQVNMYHTVAALNGAVYGFSGKALQCTSLEDGRVLWEQAGGDWGNGQSLIVADGLIFALTTKGDLVLIEANQTGCKELGRVATKIRLGIPQQPTLANGRLYVRGDTTVVCYDVRNARN